MPNCKPCFDEGKGQILAHYGPDGHTKRPPMCFDHYWKAKGKAPVQFLSATIISRERPQAESNPCTVKGCAFPANGSGMCRQHELREIDNKPLETEPIPSVVDDKCWCGKQAKHPGGHIGDKLGVPRRATVISQEDVEQFRARVGESETEDETLDKALATVLRAKDFEDHKEPETPPALAKTSVAGQPVETAPGYEIFDRRSRADYCYSDEQRSQVVELLKSGMSVKDVNEKTGVGKATIYEIRLMVGDSIPNRKRPPRYQKLKPQKREQAAELLKDGKSIRETAEVVGLSRLTVGDVRKEISEELKTVYCECGQPVGHRGWCSRRYAESPARQETMKMLHEKQTTEITVTERNEIVVDSSPILEPQVETIPSISHKTEVLDSGCATAITTLHMQDGGMLQLFLTNNPFGMGSDERDLVFTIADLVAGYSRKYPTVPKVNTL